MLILWPLRFRLYSFEALPREVDEAQVVICMQIGGSFEECIKVGGPLKQDETAALLRITSVLCLWRTRRGHDILDSFWMVDLNSCRFMVAVCPDYQGYGQYSRHM